MTSIAVAAAIVIKNDLIFCARKAANKPLAGYWEFPGGKVEVDETPEQALQRELVEELNIHCVVKTHYMTNPHEYADKKIELAAYFCEWLTGDIQLTDHDQFKWLPISRLNELLWAPADVPIVQQLMRDIG